MKLIHKLLWIGGAISWIAVIAVAAFWFRPIGFFNQGMYLHECLTGVQSHSIPVDGHRLHYLAEGPAAGPVVVLVHGLGGSAEDWRSLAPYLVKAGFRVYIPDLPGYGRSQKPADFSYSIPDQAAVVVSFLDALGLKQVDLGGWSMGGWIAQRVAFNHPDRIRRLMLFDSAGIYQKPAWDTHLFTPNTPAELERQADSGILRARLCARLPAGCLGHPARPRRHAHRQRCHRRPAPTTENAHPARLGL